jgi:hypothetical protein
MKNDEGASKNGRQFNRQCLWSFFDSSSVSRKQNAPVVSRVLPIPGALGGGDWVEDKRIDPQITPTTAMKDRSCPGQPKNQSTGFGSFH